MPPCRHTVIVLDLLHQMLKETYSIQQRLTVLAKSSGWYLQLLSTAVVHLLPALSAEVSPVCNAIVTPHTCKMLFIKSYAQCMHIALSLTNT